MVAFPAFGNVTIACKNNAKSEDQCLEIAELFINKSKWIISNQIGYAIKIEILKQQGKSKELIQVQSEKKQYRERFECLLKIMNYGFTFASMKGVEFSRISDPIERVFGELAYYSSMAQLNYDYHSKLGDDNINNPVDCKKWLTDKQ